MYEREDRARPEEKSVRRLIPWINAKILLEKPLMRDDTKKEMIRKKECWEKRNVTKMGSNGEHYQVIYHFMKNVMIDCTIGYDGFVTLLLLLVIYRLGWSFNRIAFNSKKKNSTSAQVIYIQMKY